MTKPFEIPKQLVWEAFQRVKANGGSPGVDEEKIEAFEARLGDNLYKLWNRMTSGSYFPPPVKAVPIPKKNGGTRILGVPTVADRVRKPPQRWFSSLYLSQCSTETHLATAPGALGSMRWNS